MSEISVLRATNAGPGRALRWLGVCAVGLVFLGLLAGASLVFAQKLLCVEGTPTQADALVVLGGDPRARSARAAELFKEKLASQILISGNGDWDLARALLISSGVRSNAIVVEGRSDSTIQNAEFTVPLLQSQGAHRVIVVTSWYHSRRALQCFRHCAPKMQFISLPTIADRPKSFWPNRENRGYILSEYAKLCWYWLRYSISPI
jgi:uncharacterized SAM-binding protein YcdF (DUF218 family)